MAGSCCSRPKPGLKVRPEFRNFAGSYSFASNDAERPSERLIGKAFGAAGAGAGVGPGTFGTMPGGISLGGTIAGVEPPVAGGAIVGIFGADVPPSRTVPSSTPSTASP